jgi:hypothetical protein
MAFCIYPNNRRLFSSSRHLPIWYLPSAKRFLSSAKHHVMEATGNEDIAPCIFFSGEGPRSRRYGRTAVLRLIVQPCDEDEDDYYFFVLFLVMEHRWNEIDRGKPKNSGKNLSQCSKHS